MMSQVDELFDKALELEEEGKNGEAMVLYEDIISKMPNWSTPYYNLGLICKYRGDWKKSFEYNLKATQLDPESEAAWWNLGIASTALKNWRMARTAWNNFGLNFEINDEEPTAGSWDAPIRINPEEEAEVVWAVRIDPARAIIKSIPLAKSGHRYGDMILNDGAPVGKRQVNGQEYSVFNELELLQKSNFKTFSVIIKVDEEYQLEKLFDLLSQYDLPYENWTETVQFICKQCSEGTPHEKHDRNLEISLQSDNFNIAIASQNQEIVSELLIKWKVITLCDFEELNLELE
jgi:tetratricopeptide (TPR) repeat protein